MKFGDIIDGLKEGKKYRRTSWPKAMRCIADDWDDGFEIHYTLVRAWWKRPYVLHPSDVFADDWEEVE